MCWGALSVKCEGGDPIPLTNMWYDEAENYIVYGTIIAVAFLGWSALMLRSTVPRFAGGSLSVPPKRASPRRRKRQIYGAVRTVSLMALALGAGLCLGVEKTARGWFYLPLGVMQQPNDCREGIVMHADTSKSSIKLDQLQNAMDKFMDQGHHALDGETTDDKIEALFWMNRSILVGISGILDSMAELNDTMRRIEIENKRGWLLKLFG